MKDFLKKEDYYGMYLLSEGEFLPVEIREGCNYSLAFLAHLGMYGLLFKNREDAMLACKHITTLVQGISSHWYNPEPNWRIDMARKPRVYISGAISGHDLNERRAAFRLVELELKERGFEVFNPMENGLPADATTAQHMRRDLNELTREDKPYDYICLMEGWNLSAGCWTEFHDALACGMKVIFVNQGDTYHFI